MKANNKKILIEKRLVVSPACLHGVLKGLLDLFLTGQDALQLLTYHLSHVKGQSVTALPLSQKYPCKAAAAGIHCWDRERKKIQTQCLIGFITMYT